MSETNPTPYDPETEELDESQVEIHTDAPDFEEAPWANTVDGKQDEVDSDDDPAKDSTPAPPQTGGPDA